MSSSTMVGPIVRCGDVADAVAEAAVIDNPNRDVTVEDHTAYLRVQCAEECVITRETMQDTLGRPFEMRELEVNLASFAGQIETTTDHVRFFVSGRPS
jgi:toluene monooxygenase system protein D